MSKTTTTEEIVTALGHIQLNPTPNEVEISTETVEEGGFLKLRIESTQSEHVLFLGPGEAKAIAHVLQEAASGLAVED